MKRLLYLLPLIFVFSCTFRELTPEEKIVDQLARDSIHLLNTKDFLKELGRANEYAFVSIKARSEPEPRIWARRIKEKGRPFLVDSLIRKITHFETEIDSLKKEYGKLKNRTSLIRVRFYF